MNRSLIIAKNLLQTCRVLTTQPRFSFSKREEEWLDNRKKSQEKYYFDQEDKKAMKRLLDKLNTTSKFVEDIDYNASEAVACEKILKRYNVQYTQALVDELVDWKQGR